MRRFCTACSTKTICACSSPQPYISAAAARASASAACCRVWARRKRVRSWRNAGKSRFGATSAIARLYSMQWMLRSFSIAAFSATAAAGCTSRVALGTALIWAVLCKTCGAAPAPFYAGTFEKVPSAAAMSAVGRALFFDKSLSASGKMACATCHDPNRGFGPPNDLPVQRGGADGRQAGARAVPSLMYAQNVPAFTEHYVEDEDDDSIDQGPAGGRTWDGRAQSAHDQARLPLFSSYEMATENAETVVLKVRHAAYAALFRETFGEEVFADSALAFKAVLLALETY